MTQFVEVQHLAGNRVRDAEGTVAGRLESIRAETIGPRCFVQEYHLGSAALLSRLGMGTSRLFGITLDRKLLRVPWQQLDLSDPAQPRLRCSLEELKALQSQLPPFEDEGPPERMAGKKE